MTRTELALALAVGELMMIAEGARSLRRRDPHCAEFTAADAVRQVEALAPDAVARAIAARTPEQVQTTIEED